jgi:hypothetical protein
VCGEERGRKEKGEGRRLAYVLYTATCGAFCGFGSSGDDCVLIVFVVQTALASEKTVA